MSLFSECVQTEVLKLKFYKHNFQFVKKRKKDVILFSVLQKKERLLHIYIW